VDHPSHGYCESNRERQKDRQGSISTSENEEMQGHGDELDNSCDEARDEHRLRGKENRTSVALVFHRTVEGKKDDQEPDMANQGDKQEPDTKGGNERTRGST